MFITDLKSISPQKTYANEFLLGEIVEHDKGQYTAEEPNYTKIIRSSLLRRMGKAVRMGIGAGLPMIKFHNDIDGIIIGTANGGLENCIQFLNQIVEYDEGMITPTNFVQSTPNAIAGQLALMDQNRGYNITYTNDGHAFENAILDALLLFEERAANKLLIGGVEEISDYNYNIDKQCNLYKNEKVSNINLLNSTTKGTICGEGSNMFIVEREAKNYLAEIVDVAQLANIKPIDLQESLIDFLNRNGLQKSDIDTLMLGNNGNVDENIWYTYFSDEVLPKTNILTFKQFSGEYRTSSSFAVWLSAQILSDGIKNISLMMQRSVTNKKIKTIVIYNHFNAVNHNFVLIQK